jgi:DNA-binding GntR family transcriptional regulator
MITVHTLTSRVYERLLQMIVAGELTPGCSLRESDLAARLGVSRTPVREALHRLEEYGLVAMRPNHGAVVRRLGREEVIAIHQVREAMEGLACELACGRLTPEDLARLDDLAEAAREPHAPNHFEAFDRFDAELHATVAARSGNPLLVREIVKLHRISMLVHDQLESIQVDAQRMSPAERDETRSMFWRQHVVILDELRSGSRSGARRAMIKHVRATCAYRTRLISPPAQAEPAARDGRGLKNGHDCNRPADPGGGSFEGPSSISGR